MVSHVRVCLKRAYFFLNSSISRASFGSCSRAFSSLCTFPVESTHFERANYRQQEEQCLDPARLSDFDILVAKARGGINDDEVLQSLMRDQECDGVRVTRNLVHKLLVCFKDDWKSAQGVFRWAGSRSDYEHTSETYDLMVDILGRTKQMDKMRAILDEMRFSHLVTLNTVAKAMRRFAGARKWEDAVRIFDDLESFGLEKNTESMNLLLDTLCKEKKVEQARQIFLELKSHISPNAHTFNIFIHGWCKANMVDEAEWTIQEMKGHGCQPCVISYSTIIQFYCYQDNFSKVYELFDKMQAQGCPPNVVTYTTVMCSLAKLQKFEEAIQIDERRKSVRCKADVLFYNALIHTLGRAGRVQDAIDVFELEMPNNSVFPNTSTYNSMISMLCHHSLLRRAYDLLLDFENQTFCKPDVQTYYPLLKSCFKSGKTGSFLRKLLDDMVDKHHLSLDLSAYTLLIHGLCRADKCEWAYFLFDEMLGKDITPRYKTCSLLLNEVKQKSMYNAAERIEDYMKKL